MLKIYNTLSQKKEIFKPINSNMVNIYVCGITAYDFCHIGHGRTFIIFDIVVNYLNFIGYKVNYVRNITDIDDKIIYKSSKNNENYSILTNRIINEMHKDFDSLGIIRPNSEPKVTNFINISINLISKLIEKGHAYLGSNGDVIFSISSFKQYGILSKQYLKKLKNKISIETFQSKNNPADFVLWKLTKKNEPSWPSPWGKGRPGWHTECAAINQEKFGSIFDIHGGGTDLIFPHHENEIAQSFCAYGRSYSNFWMHCGMVTINQKKMSKSKNNTLSIRKLLNLFDSESLRYFLISSHYRNNIEYSEQKIKESRLALEKLYLTLKDTNFSTKTFCGKYFIQKFKRAMNDDFNTPKACSILFEVAKVVNDLKKKNLKKQMEWLQL